MKRGPFWSRVVLGCIGFVLWVPSGVMAQGTGATERVRIAVLPLVVHSADDPKFLREGFRDMLASRIDQIEPFEIIEVADPTRATTDLDAALATANEIGADVVLFGSFTRFGQGASLDVQMAATDPRPGQLPVREIFVHSGSIGEIIPDLDKLVGKLGSFALEDYTPGSAVAAAPPQPGAVPAQADSIADLTARVEALEAAIATLMETRTASKEAE